ncbi:hypothetical protein ANN_22721, partial [Periplaneta americana]
LTNTQHLILKADEEIQAVMNELSDDNDDPPPDVDEREIINNDNADHYSDSEIGYTGSSYNEGLEDNENFYVGRDKVTMWRKTPHSTSSKTKTKNIMNIFPGPKGNAWVANLENKPVIRREFFKNLVLQLMKPLLIERSMTVSLLSDIKAFLQLYKPPEEELHQNVDEPPMKKRSRCMPCKNKWTQMKCNTYRKEGS